MAGGSTGGCGCGQRSVGGPIAQAKASRPQDWQFYVFDQPGGKEFATTSWGVFVTQARLAGVTSGRIEVRSIQGGQVVAVKSTRPVSLTR